MLPLFKYAAIKDGILSKANFQKCFQFIGQAQNYTSGYCSFTEKKKQSNILKQFGLSGGTDRQVIFEKIGVNRLSREQCLFFQINLPFVRKYIYP